MMRAARILAAAASAMVALSGCGVSPDPHPRLLSAADVPRGVRPSTSATSSGSARTLVYLIHDGVLVAVARAVPPDPGPATVLTVLLGGPSRREQDAGLVTAVTSASTAGPPRGGVVVVDVPAPGASSSGRTDEVLGFGQIVLSLTSLRGVTAISFTRDGKPLAVPRADGSLSSAPLTRRDYTDLL